MKIGISLGLIFVLKIYMWQRHVFDYNIMRFTVLYVPLENTVKISNLDVPNQ